MFGLLTKVTQETDANLLGELLRQQFFKKRDEIDFGCYSTFEYNDGVIKEEEEPISYYEDGWNWQVASIEVAMNVSVKMRWFWDGDGTLTFELPDGRLLATEDCKKNYRWEFWPSFQDFCNGMKL